MPFFLATVLLSILTNSAQGFKFHILTNIAPVFFFNRDFNMKIVNYVTKRVKRKY